jgi:hypothetical protein
LILTLAVSAGLLCVLPGAQAATLLPNHTVPLTPSDDITLPAGTLLASGSATASPNSGAYTATLNYAVYKEAGGALDFLYQVSNSGSSSDTLEKLVASSFSKFTTDVFYSSSAVTGFSSGTVEPTSAKRSGTVGGETPGAKNVSFNFSLDPGQTSKVLVIRTNAGGYGTGGTTSVIDSVAVSFSTFAPTPEPASLVLLGGCFVGLAGAYACRRWRKPAPVVA